jgi:hypothetical protein
MRFVPVDTPMTIRQGGPRADRVRPLGYYGNRIVATIDIGQHYLGARDRDARLAFVLGAPTRHWPTWGNRASLV